MISKAVIPSAGLGSRLLPITKELPKEMLPVFIRKDNNANVLLKPVLQCIFEQLYDTGIRDFCFIIGRSKRAIEDHFTPDSRFIEYLKNRNGHKLTDDLEQFYDRVRDSSIVFINQCEPKGFGHAILKAKVFTGDEDFLVHAGDDLILSKNNNHFHRIVNTFENLKSDAIFFVDRVKNPRSYGIIHGIEVSEGTYEVEDVIEKPRMPSSNLAIIAIYIFRPTIYQEIRNLKPDHYGEIQLTDAIRGLITKGKKVHALELVGGKRLDTGSIKTYWEALDFTHRSVCVLQKHKYKSLAGGARR